MARDPCSRQPPREEALLPEQAAADGPPALDRLQIAGLPVGIAGEDGKVRLNVEPGRGFVPEDESDGVVFDVGNNKIKSFTTEPRRHGESKRQIGLLLNR